MKKFLFFIPVIAVVLLLTMTQCKKNYDCGLKITCYYSPDGIKVGDPIPNVDLDIYPTNANPPSDHFIDTVEIEPKRHAKTDENGVYQTVYKNEALLNISATYIEKLDTAEIHYTGTGQIKLQEGEIVEKAILMIPGI